MKKAILIILFVISGRGFAQTTDMFLQGMAELRKTNYTEAEAFFTKALDENSGNKGKIYLNRGICYFQKGNYDAAIEDFGEAHKQNQKEAALWLAKSYAEKTIDNLSINYLKEYLENHPEEDYNPVIKSSSFRKIQQTDRWQIFIGELEQTEESEATATYNYYLEKRDFQSAQKSIDKMLAKNSSSAYFHSLKANCYELEGNYSLALYEINQAVMSNPTSCDYRMLCGKYQILLKDYSSAIGSYKEAIKQKPEEFEAYVQLAKANLLEKNIPQARQNISFYLNYFEKDTTAILLSAKIAYEMSDYTTCLKQVNSLFSQFQPQSEWFLLRGLAYYQSGNYKVAASDLSMCLDLTPANQDANYFLGQSHFQMGNNRLACYYWQRAETSGDMRSFEMLQKYCGK